MRHRLIFACRKIRLLWQPIYVSSKLLRSHLWNFSSRCRLHNFNTLTTRSCMMKCCLTWLYDRLSFWLYKPRHSLARLEVNQIWGTRDSWGDIWIKWSCWVAGDNRGCIAQRELKLYIDKLMYPVILYSILVNRITSLLSLLNNRD